MSSSRLEEIENLLQTYSFEEILELNDLTEAEILLFLLSEQYLELPDIKPLS